MQENKQDKETKSIYNVSYGTIFFKNFFAGFARALGSIVVYLVLGGLIYYLVVTKFLPQINLLIPKYGSLLGPMPQQSTQNISDEDMQNVLEYYQKQQAPN